MTGRYVKTAAGREAIHARVHALSRPARNLLLVIDGSRTGAEWVALVGGSSEADLAQLLQAGLLQETAAVAPAVPAVPAVPAMPALPAVHAPASGRGLEEALAALSYRELYDRLTGEARARLGLIKGYRMVLEIEKCSGAEEIRKLALRFIGDVRAAQGDEAARKLSRDLGADV